MSVVWARQPRCSIPAMLSHKGESVGCRCAYARRTSQRMRPFRLETRTPLQQWCMRWGAAVAAGAARPPVRPSGSGCLRRAMQWLGEVSGLQDSCATSPTRSGKPSVSDNSRPSPTTSSDDCKQGEP